MEPDAPRGRLLLLGGGGHAAVVADAAVCAGFEVIGCCDDDRCAPDPPIVVGFEADGSPRALRNLGMVHAHLVTPPDGAEMVLAVGSLGRRKLLVEQAPTRARFAVVAHPSAVVARGVDVGVGTFVAARAVVNARAAVGAHAILNTGCVVEHDCVVGENVHVAPGAVLCGDVRVGRDTLIGAGAVVLPGRRVGSGATVGAGSVVTRDVADNTVIAGNPAECVSVRRGAVG